MDDTRKRPGGGVQVQLRRRSRSTKRTTTWDGTAFLVSIDVRLYGRVCNSLFIFMAPPYSSSFSPSINVAVEVAFP